MIATHSVHRCASLDRDSTARARSSSTNAHRHSTSSAAGGRQVVERLEAEFHRALLVDRVHLAVAVVRDDPPALEVVQVLEHHRQIVLVEPLQLLRGGVLALGERVVRSPRALGIA